MENLKLDDLDKVLTKIKEDVKQNRIKNVSADQISYAVFKTNYVREDLKAQYKPLSQR